MDDIVTIILCAWAGAAIGWGAAYAYNTRQKLNHLIAQVAVLEQDVNFLFSEDPEDDDPDENHAEPAPQNVVAIGGRR